LQRNTSRSNCIPPLIHRCRRSFRSCCYIPGIEKEIRWQIVRLSAWLLHQPREYYRKLKKETEIRQRGWPVHPARTVWS
jgi:hypothetical protein